MQNVKKMVKITANPMRMHLWRWKDSINYGKTSLFRIIIKSG